MAFRFESELLFAMLNLRLEEITIVACFTLLHLGLYHYTAHLPPPKVKALPIQIQFLHPKKPEPKPEPKVEEPKPKLIEAPPKPKEPPKKPKPVKPKVKPKKVVKKPEVRKVVYKPRLQQESVVKVHAEEVVVKEVVEHAQPISEPVVKKHDPKPEPKEEPEDPPEPKHVPVITKVTGIGSCSSTLNNYPAEAREEGLEGTVKVKVTVSASGNVSGASIVKSSGHAILDQSVMSNVYDCNFEPAEKDGKPISSKVVVPVRFKLN
jgi:protein TonB